MQFHEAALPGVLVFQPEPVRDERGFFTRTFDAGVARAAGLEPGNFVQDSQSRSRQGVIRGIHVRSGEGEAKLVRCSAGAVFDVVVDLRPGSDTFGHWLSLRLDDVTNDCVYVPAGFGHGFQALTDPADVCYRIDQPHDPRFDVTLRFDDPALAIPWPLPVTLLSERDAAARPLGELPELLG